MTSTMFPMRTGGWSKLAQKDRDSAIEFTRKLWFHVFDHISPSVIVCLGEDPYDCFRRVLSGKGYKETERSRGFRVGWQNYTYSQARYERGGKQILIVGLPHLARRMIFSNLAETPERREAVERFTDAIAQSLREP